MKEITNRRKIISILSVAGAGTFLSGFLKIKGTIAKAFESKKELKVSIHPLAVKRNEKVNNG